MSRARRRTPSLQELIVISVGVGAFLLSIATIRTPILHGLSVSVSAATATATAPSTITSTLLLHMPTYDYSSERPSVSTTATATETDKGSGRSLTISSSATTSVNGTNTYFENPVLIIGDGDDGNGYGCSSTTTTTGTGNNNEVSVSFSLALPEEWNLSNPPQLLQGAKDILLEVVATTANELFVLSLYRSIHVVTMFQDHHIIMNETTETTTNHATTTTSSASNQLFEEWIMGKQAEKAETTSRSYTSSSNILLQQTKQVQAQAQEQQEESPDYGYGGGDGSGHSNTGGGYSHNDAHGSEGSSSGSENDYGYNYGYGYGNSKTNDSESGHGYDNSEAGMGTGNGQGNGSGSGSGIGSGYGNAYGQPQDKQHPDEVWHLFLSKISYNLVEVHESTNHNKQTTYSWWQITLTYPVFVNASATNNGAVGTINQNSSPSAVEWAPVCQQGTLEFITRLLQQELNKAIRSGTFLSNMQDIAFLYIDDVTPPPINHADPGAVPDHHHHIVSNVLALAVPGNEYVLVLDDDGEVIEQEEEQVPELEATPATSEPLEEEVEVVHEEDDPKEESMTPDTESSATMPPSTPGLPPFEPDRLGTYSRSILDDEPDHHYELRLKVGLWMLITTSALVGSMVVLSVIKSAVVQYLERKAQVDDTWKLATEEDVDEILNIGWRQYVIVNNRAGENSKGITAEVLEAVDKTGVGYRDGDSMLHGSAFL